MNLLGDGAKPWKAVLSSDGLSDVGTPIFCLRRGKSVAGDSMGVLTSRFRRVVCLQASDQRKRVVEPSGARTRVKGRALGKL